jgi:hypothetical protein
MGGSVHNLQITRTILAFEFHLPMDYIVNCSFVCMSTTMKVEYYLTKQIVRGIIFGLDLWCLTVRIPLLKL